MTIDFDKLETECNRRVNRHRERNIMFDAMKKMVFMQWDGQPGAPHIKATMSPDPYNTIMGICRLLISTDPRITVTPDSIDSTDEEAADHLEKALKNLWGRVNKKRRWPVHYDAVMAASMFSEVCLQIGRTQDTVDMLEGRPEATLMKRYAQQVPYTIDVLDPATVYPEYGAFGLRSILRRYVRPMWQIREFWGNKADPPGKPAIDPNTTVEFNDYWDAENRVVWVKGSDPFVNEEHGLPFIPFVSAIVTGSGMFQEPVEQRLPLLYPLWKGEWWHRQNLSYTLLYTTMTILGNGSWVSKTENGSGVTLDLTQPTQQVPLKLGESIEPLGLQLLPNEITVAMDLASAKMAESSLPRVVFGESPSKTMSYSSLNLLSQGGRLPLVPIERQVGSALAEAFEIILKWVSYAKDDINLWSADKTPDLLAAEINPDHLEVSVTLKADIPQDKLSLANVVSMLMGAKAGDGMPIISRRQASELLGNDQPDDELEQIVSEKLIGLYINAKITEKMTELQPQPEQQAQKPVEGTGFDPSRGGIPPVMAGGQTQSENPVQMDHQEEGLNALLGPRTVGD
jgi:hypothetical protein